MIRRGIRISAERGGDLRLSDSEHLAQPWRIHEITRDFRVEDVWELPGSLDAADFPRFTERVAALDLADSRSAAVRLLVAVRMKLGDTLRLDRQPVR